MTFAKKFKFSGGVVVWMRVQAKAGLPCACRYPTQRDFVL